MQTTAAESRIDISSRLRTGLSRLVELVTREARENLAGLTLYGEAIGPDGDAGLRAATTVLVLHRADLPLLRRMAESGPSLAAKDIAPPTIMTPAYIRDSLDTFPLELIEIQQRRITLCGEDYFKTIAPHAEHVRLQCERELKIILIRLRQGLLAAGAREDFLSDLELDVGDHLARTLRGLAWLHGRREALPREGLLREAEQLVGANLPGARGAVLGRGEHGWAEFQTLYEDVERLAGAANAA